MPVSQKLSQIRPMTQEEQQAMMQQIVDQQRRLQQAAARASAPAAAAKPGFDENNPETWGHPGRNDLCPCGSGNKFKHCHGRLA